jgi:V/A-type H+/Na+-transporting ATPase subunit E
MDNRLQELTDKIYQEGISKGNEEAEKIVSDARAEAEKILADAKKKAEDIVSEAGKKSAEFDQNTKSELKLASRQAVDALKQELVGIINGTITSTEIKAAMGDAKFVQKAIETAVKNWAVHNEETIDMQVLIPKEDEKAIRDYFAGVAKGVLDKGFSIETVNNLKAGFQVAPADGSYKVSFTDEDFINFFKEFLRPKIVELLFEK